jgi:DNA polymerase-3 subunit delta
MGKTLQGYRRLFEGLKTGAPHRVYFLYGPEEFLKKEFVRELVEVALPEKERTFNLDVIHGDEFDPAAFDDRVSSFGLFMERRVVILRNFKALSTAHKDHVVSAAKSAPEGVVLVVSTPEERLETVRHKNLKKIADARGMSFCFSHLDDTETLERVRSRLGRAGLAIAPDALDLLVESVGTQLADLGNEVDKIILAAPEGRPIDRDLVAAVVGRYRTENLFGFLDGLSPRNPALLLRRLGTLLDAGEEPVFVLTMLLRRVVQMLEIHAIVEEKGRAAAGKGLAGFMAAPTNPYFADRLRTQARAFDRDHLERLLTNLRWADARIKSTALPPRTLIEEALLASHLGRNLA